MDRDLALRGGPHVLTVADIRNIVVGMQADLSSIEEEIESRVGYGVSAYTDSRIQSLRDSLQILCQFDNDRGQE